MNVFPRPRFPSRHCRLNAYITQQNTSRRIEGRFTAPSVWLRVSHLLMADFIPPVTDPKEDARSLETM